MAKKKRSGKKTNKPSRGKRPANGAGGKTLHKRERKKNIVTATRTIRDISVYGLKPSKKSPSLQQGTTKKTFHIKKDLLKKLQSHASGEKITVTEALHRILKKELQRKRRKK